MAKVVTYTVDYCPYCRKAKELLTKKGIEFEDHDITADEDKMRKELEKMTDGLNTVPQIFINGISIGGFTDLKELDDTGKLDRMLEE